MTDEQQNNQQPQSEPEVAPELKDRYEQLQNMIRGNIRREEELQQYGQMMSPFIAFMMRLDMLLDLAIGQPHSHGARLEFEEKFADSMRSMIDQALFVARAQGAPQPPPAPSLFMPNGRH